MNKFSFSLAVAAMTCAAGLSACKDDKKPADTAAPAASTAPAPAPAAEPAKPAEPPAMAPAAPAPEKKSEAAPAEPEKMAAAAPEAPKAEAPKAEAPKAADAAPAAAPAPAAEPAKPADAKPAEAATPAPSDTKAADAKPAEAAAPATPPAASDAKPAAPAGDASTSADGAVTAADAKPPADDIKDKTSPPDPVSELAKQKGFKFDDGRYRNKDGDPQPIVTKDFMVDWGTWNGFRRYHDACHVCHGPNAMGSTFAPALKDSLKTLDYSTFVATVSGGKQENRGGTMFVMPSFGTDKNIMCYLDDIYTYIKARSLNDTSGGKDGMPAGRPNGREDISDDTKKAADQCTSG